jgi:vancomycin resistance protein YoaR
VKSKLQILLIVLVFGMAFAGIQTWGSFNIAPYSDKVSFTTASTLSAQLVEDKDKEYRLEIEGEYIILRGEELTSLIEPYVRSSSHKEEYRISKEKMDKLLVEIAQGVISTPINARITIIDGIPTTLFEGVLGKELDMQASGVNILKGIVDGKSTIELTMKYVEPELTLEKFKELKIIDLLAKGESNFAGSSDARAHNINVGAARYNGRLIPPGEIFSFNALLGEVNAETGFLHELVIKNKKIIPEYGGGVCQVSSTLYRAVLSAGLPIVERRNHSFPVRHYSPQGLDATIYPGVVDFKFKNDTGEYILIQTRVEGTKLIFELYGKDDGRIVTIDGPYPYPREDDGLYTSLTRTVKKGDTEIKESFNSLYRSREEYPLERNPLE